MTKVPYATQFITEDDIGGVSEALRSDYLTQGPNVAEFEKKVADYCGARYAVALNSGTSALHAACFAAGVSLGDEVITSLVTFVASANCVLYCGGQPVFSDVQEDTVNIDPEKIENKITKKTKAIIPVHFAGQPCEMKIIQQIAKKHNIVVIEDGAHALGASYLGSKIGSCKFSHMTVFSFHAVKHITTGEGGMVLTNDKNYYDKLLLFRSHGITKNVEKFINKDEGSWYYEMQFLGFNYRLTDFQCALGMKQLMKLDGFMDKRREIVNKYRKEFSDIRGVILPIEKPSLQSSWHLFVIRVQRNRRKIYEALRKKGVLVNVHYIPVYWQPFYQKLGYCRGLCPSAEKYYKEALTLPLFPKMKDSEVLYVIEEVKKVISQYNGENI